MQLSVYKPINKIPKTDFGHLISHRGGHWSAAAHLPDQRTEGLRPKKQLRKAHVHLMKATEERDKLPFSERTSSSHLSRLLASVFCPSTCKPSQAHRKPIPFKIWAPSVTTRQTIKTSFGQCATLPNTVSQPSSPLATRLPVPSQPKLSNGALRRLGLTVNRDNGKENGNYYNMLGLYSILGLIGGHSSFFVRPLLLCDHTMRNCRGVLVNQGPFCIHASVDSWVTGIVCTKVALLPLENL